jgi:hypothetical protein
MQKKEGKKVFLNDKFWIGILVRVHHNCVWEGVNA